MYNHNLQAKSSSILVVDDEPVNIKLIEKILATEGYENIVSTVDPRNVVELYQTHQSDLILLDINMPYLDGFEVMEQFQKKFGEDHAPILVLTAQSSQEFRLKAFESGARDYITKPFDRYELVARVKNLLDVQLAHKSLSQQNDVLEQKVQERTQELLATRLQIIRRLGRAAEYRDNETGMHIIRMSKISELLGRAAGMNNHTCSLLLDASPMHDIGKIGIPDHILLKPGSLEPDEWEIMKTHAQIGADILSGDDSELLTMAREIAITHHEKWDGSGYPNALVAENIPLTGRIVAIADVFDALTSVRPYKHAWPIEEAVSFMKDQSGMHFQPELIGIFLEKLPEIIAIREAYPEPENT